MLHLLQIDPKSKEKVQFVDKTNVAKHMMTHFSPEVRLNHRGVAILYWRNLLLRFYVCGPKLEHDAKPSIMSFAQPGRVVSICLAGRYRLEVRMLQHRAHKRLKSLGDGCL